MSAASYAGATTSVVSSLTLTDWGILAGIITALLTFAANQIWQARKDRRELVMQQAADRRAQRIHDLEVERLCRMSAGANELPSCRAANE